MECGHYYVARAVRRKGRGSEHILLLEREMSAVEDSLAFLARLTNECPNVLSFLTTEQARLLSKKPTDLYQLRDVNEEYLTDMACYYSVLKKSRDSEVSLSSALLTPRAKNKELDVETFKKNLKALNEVSCSYTI